MQYVHAYYTSLPMITVIGVCVCVCVCVSVSVCLAHLKRCKTRIIAFLAEGVAAGPRVLLPTKTLWFTLVMHGLITHVYLLSVEKNTVIQQTLLMRVL